MHLSGPRRLLPIALLALGLAVAAGLAITLSLGLAPSPASAQDDQFAVLTLETLRDPATTSLAPVRVGVGSSRAVEGRIVVQSQTNNTTWEYPVALAANTQITQTFVAPVAWGELRLDASFIVDGQEVAEARTNNNGGNGPNNAVGVIGLEYTDAEVPLTPSLGTAALIPLDELSLLAGLDSVVASPAGLQTLTSSELATLLVWTGAGHQLLIADDPGTIDSLLPARWQGSTNHRFADAGLIRYVGRDWESGVTPGLSSSSDQRFGPQFNRFETSSVHRETLADAGFRVPGIRAIAVVLMIYLLVAGPIAFGVLHVRKQRTRAWVVIPALSLLFTIGVLVVGGLLTRGRGNGYASIVEVTAAGAGVTDTVLLADSGRQTLDLPQGWALLSGNFGTGNFGPGSDLTVRPTRNSTSVEFDIGSGSGGTAVVRGIDGRHDGALMITNVRVSGATINGVVANNSAVRLSKVVAMVGDRAAAVPDIGPGESVEFTIEATGNGRAGSELRVWGTDDWFQWDADRNDPEVVDGPINASAWLDWRARRGASAVPAGVVTLVGWTRDAESATLDGTGRTAFVARHSFDALIGPASAAFIRHIVPMESLGNGLPPVRPGAVGDLFQFQRGAHQFIRPTGSTTDEIALRVNRGVGEVQVWTADGWRSLNIEANARARVAVPAEAWIDDVLWVRGETQNFGAPNAAPQIALEDLADPPSVELLEVGATSARVPQFDEPAEIFADGPALLGMSTDVAASDTAEQVIDAEGMILNTYDVWRLELSNGDRVIAEMNSLDDGFDEFGGLDPHIKVYDSGRFLILENDDHGRGLDSRVEFTAQSDGWHEVEMRPLSGGAGPYQALITIQRGQQ